MSEQKKSKEIQNGSIYSQHQQGGITAGTINAAYVIGRDMNMHAIDENSKIEEILKLFENMKIEIDNLNVPDKEKNKAKRRMDDAIDEVKTDTPDKKSVANSLIEAGKILESASAIALKATAFGQMLTNGLIWAGKALGWL